MWFLKRICFTWNDLVLAIVQLPWTLMANQTLLQIYAINLNITGYIGLFFLTEKIYEKICFRKSKNQHWGSLHTSNSACLFFSSSLSHKWVISATSNALKLNKSTHQYVTMATAEPISIFLCLSSYITTTCHKIKLGRNVFLVSYLLKVLIHIAKYNFWFGFFFVA